MLSVKWFKRKWRGYQSHHNAKKLNSQRDKSPEIGTPLKVKADPHYSGCLLILKVRSFQGRCRLLQHRLNEGYLSKKRCTGIVTNKAGQKNKAAAMWSTQIILYSPQSNIFLKQGTKQNIYAPKTQSLHRLPNPFLSRLGFF